VVHGAEKGITNVSVDGKCCYIIFDNFFFISIDFPFPFPVFMNP
jgi:hypothetical protein